MSVTFLRVLGSILLILTLNTLSGCEIINSISKTVQKKLPPINDLDAFLPDQAVTTTFKDAKTEVELFGDFDTSKQRFIRLSHLSRTENGGYKLFPGLFSDRFYSFCMHAGKYGPSGGDGYLLAPLKGPKADLIHSLLENWQSEHSEITQSQVQLLIWAIIDNAEISKIQLPYKLTLMKLLSKDDYEKLIKLAVLDIGKQRIRTLLNKKAPPFVKTILKAREKMNLLYQKVNVRYEEFESYAVMAGLAPASYIVRDIPSGRWSFNRKGRYFIRFFPKNYKSTRVDVYVPRRVNRNTDSLGRIDSVYDDNTFGIKMVYSGMTTTVMAISYYRLGFDLSTIAFEKGVDVKGIPGNGSNDSSVEKSGWKQLGIPSLAAERIVNLSKSEKEIVFHMQSLKNALLVSTDPSNLIERKSLIEALDEASNSMIYQSLTSGVKDESERLLNLPDNVATPANTARQRLAVANNSSKYCSSDDVTIIDEIPSIMLSQKPAWTVGARLMNIWKQREPNDKPTEGVPVTDVVTMDWAFTSLLSYTCYKSSLLDKVWMTQRAKDKILEMIGKMVKDGFIQLPKNEGDIVTFNPLTMQLLPSGEPVAERYYITYVPCGGPLMNDVYAALGRYLFHYAVGGTLKRTADGYKVHLDHVGVFIRDSYDFNDDDKMSLATQYLGCWNKYTRSFYTFRTLYDCQEVFNADFRSWRACRGQGGDFLIYSDIKVSGTDDTLPDIPLSRF